MIRIGVVGLGGFGSRLANEVDTQSNATLAAVADTDPNTLRDAVVEFDLDESVCFSSEAELYDHTALDAVIISTPPAVHAPQLRKALERDLHVLCEKPVVVDLEEARTLATLTDSSDAVVMAGYQRHLDPAFIAGYERWHESDAEPTFITGELTQDWTHHFESGTNWRTDPDVGGRGHLFSVGTHVLESILWMTGLTPESVSAEMAFYDDDRQIDTQSSLTIQFDNGAIASVADSAIVATERERIRIWDDDGALQLTARDWERPTLTLIDTDGDESTPAIDRDGVGKKVEAFVESIETGSEPPATVEDVLRVTALLDAAYDAARTGERVPVENALEY